jgi:hypothetical protein
MDVSCSIMGAMVNEYKISEVRLKEKDHLGDLDIDGSVRGCGLDCFD